MLSVHAHRVLIVRLQSDVMPDARASGLAGRKGPDGGQDRRGHVHGQLEHPYEAGQRRPRSASPKGAATFEFVDHLSRIILAPHAPCAIRYMHVGC